MKSNLPKRFWLESDYDKDEVRFKKSIIHLKTSEFKKIYNKIINPYLKSLGFKCNGMKAILENEKFNFMVIFASKYGGTGNLTLLSHPKGYPTKDHYEFSPNEPHHYLFSQHLELSNGNSWIDIGSNQEEAIETSELLLELLKNQLERFIQSFQSFDKKIETIKVQDFEKGKDLLINDLGLRNESANVDAAISLWLSRFHDSIGSKPEAISFAKLVVELEDDPFSKLSLLAENILNFKSYHWTKENNDKFWKK